VRDFLARNRLSYRWFMADEPDGQRILEAAGLEALTPPGMLPGPGELSATLLLEFVEPQRVREELLRLRGLHRHVALAVADARVPGVFEEGRESDMKLSAVQYVRFPRRAWHAGASSWAGRERCNDYSIGIEIEGTDASPYEAAQYATVASLIVELCRAYPSLSIERVVGHSDVAPGRKSDPGIAFDWPRLRTEVRLAWEPGHP